MLSMSHAASTPQQVRPDEGVAVRSMASGALRSRGGAPSTGYEFGR